jgi:hypothetical protein
MLSNTLQSSTGKMDTAATKVPSGLDFFWIAPAKYSEEALAGADRGANVQVSSKGLCGCDTSGCGGLSCCWFGALFFDN